MNVRSKSWLLLLVLALCALHVWMASSVSRTFSNTFDELAHLTAGHAYWTRGDYRFQPENGVFPQRWAALPLLAQDVTLPPPNDDAWLNGNVWRVGHAFFFQLGNDHAAMLAAGRAMNALLSGVLCGVIFFWSRQLFGVHGAWISFLLAVFSPTLLAHGGLVTSDTAGALGFVLATLAWWRLLRHVTAANILLAGAAVGLLAVSKFSAVLFAPMAISLLGVRILRTRGLPVRWLCFTHTFQGVARIPLIGAGACAVLLLCVAVIWAFYGFRFSASPPNAPDGASFMQNWGTVLLEHTDPPPALSSTDRIDYTPGVVQTFTRWARDRRLLPEPWLYGLAFVEKNSRGRLAYFAGEFRLTGWRSFFPTSFLTKSTPPELVFFLSGGLTLVFVTRGRYRIWIHRLAPVAVLLAIYAGFAVCSHLNIGHRHLLPLYPALFVLAGGAALVARHRRWLWFGLGAGLAWQAAVSANTRPDYLAYFNLIADGPDKAQRLFVDSSLDWGQDLPRLKSWLDQHADGERVFLSYFGTASPSAHGIEATRIGDRLFNLEGTSTLPKPAPGVYCISATMFSQVYSGMPYSWSEAMDKEFILLARWFAFLRERPIDKPAVWLDGSPLPAEQVQARLMRYEQLLFGRLCAFLRTQPTVAQIGFSMKVYRLNEDQVRWLTSTNP